jgi:hypothetical protein
VSPQADPDGVLIAQLHGTAKRHAQWRELTKAEHDAAVGELRELAAGRADLLAHVTGILEGTSEGELDEHLARQAAGLAREAGADPAAIAEWAEEGRRRRAAAGHPPFSQTGGADRPGPR